MTNKLFKCFCVLALFMPLWAGAQTQLHVAGIMANNKIYDGNTVATVTIGSIVGIAAGDDVTVTPSAAFVNRDADTAKVVNVSFSLSGTDANNYVAPNDTVLYADITPKQLLVYSYALGHKVYDGDTVCPILLPGLLSGLIGSDQVSLTASASFADKYAGTGKPVTMRYEIYGTHAGNYLAPNDLQLTSYITPLPITCDTVVVASAKEYDGTVGCPIDSVGSPVGVIAGDSVALQASAYFVDGASAGTAKQVVVVYAITGADSVNYSISPDSSFAADINPRILQIVDVAVADKLYDGLTTAQVTDTGSLANVVAGDTVYYSLQAAFVNRDAGVDRPAHVVVSVYGPDSANYSAPDSLFVYADITPKQLIIYSQAIGTTKTYDGTLDCPVILQGFLSGVIGNDQVSHTLQATFYTRHVGNNKPVSVVVVLSGPDSANYLAPLSFETNADILPLQMLVDSTVLDSVKVYDGTTTCGVAYAGNMLNVISPDVVALAATAEFADQWVGGNKQAVVTYSISGLNAGNYIAPLPDSSLVSSIVPKKLTVTGVAVDTTKVYDGRDTCHVNNKGTLMGVIAGDTVELNIDARYDNALVGIGKPVTLTFTLSGAQAFNYQAPDTAFATASITRRQLGAEGVEVVLAKTYDGNDTAIITTQPHATNVGFGDNGQLAISAVALYDSPQAGHNKTITVYYTAIGTKAPNYYSPEPEIYSTKGAIIMPTVFDTTDGDNPITDPEEGTCQQDNVSLTINLLQGEPVEYMLDFENDSLFQDVTTWTPLNVDGTISFALPANCPSDVYYVYVTLRDEALYTTTPVRCQFVVNFPESRIVKVFDDVVSVDNRDGLFTAYQWYHNGVAIPDADKPYYQDLSGLSGSYSVYVRLADGQGRYVCEWTDVVDDAAGRVLTVYPNPVADCLSVSLDGFAGDTHLLTIHDSYGRVVAKRQFYGDNLSLQVAMLPQGTYIVTVDGVTSKIIKK